MKIGVLLTNLGTPDAPTTKAVRKYLHEFLSDSRVVEIPKILWWPILHGIILRIRPQRSAKLYQKIWTPAGSPLRIILEEQAEKLREQLGDKFKVVTAMRYGNPSIKQALDEFKKLNIKKILLFPLYPQYCAATTATTFDKVASILKTWRWQPELRTINGYHDNEHYIQAIANNIKQYNKKNKLLFSFHGLPKSFLLKGDPYYCFCQKTARLIAEKLNLTPAQWQVSFQSRLGRAQWLQPYTDQVLEKSDKEMAVVCPGFSADCLETLEEIALRHKEFQYIPALNATPEHIDCLSALIKEHTHGWC